MKGTHEQAASAGEATEKGTRCTVGGDADGAATVGSIWRVLIKLILGLPCGPVIPLLARYPEKHKTLRIYAPHVHCSVIYNSQAVKATQVPINRRVDKKAVVRSHGGILLCHEEE